MIISVLIASCTCYTRVIVLTIIRSAEFNHDYRSLIFSYLSI